MQTAARLQAIGQTLDAWSLKVQQTASRKKEGAGLWLLGSACAHLPFKSCNAFPLQDIRRCRRRLNALNAMPGKAPNNAPR